MASVLQVATIKDQGGNANAIEIANSSANVTINQLTASTKFPAGGTGNPISVAVITDEKGTSTSGGTSSTSFTTRDLNTELYDPDNIVTISSNKFTLGAGTYLIQWSAPAYSVNNHTSLLYNATGSANLSVGSTEYTNTSDGVQSISVGSVIHTITSNNEYEIRHLTQTAKATYGLGVAHGADGNNNRYTIVKIYKLK